jgi:hypothetical protein
VEDPAIDLAVVAALISSLEDIPIPSKTCFSIAAFPAPLTRIMTFADLLMNGAVNVIRQLLPVVECSA